MSGRHAPITIRPRLDLAMLRWIGQLLANCNAHDYGINKARMLRVAQYSRDCLIRYARIPALPMMMNSAA